MLSGAGCPGSGSVDELEEHRVERSNLGQNSEDFVDGNWGKDGEKARSTCNIRNPRIKSNKTSSHQQITKKLGLFLWGNFRVRDKINKPRLENKEGAPKS